jgi:hypothetical protein
VKNIIRSVIAVCVALVALQYWAIHRQAAAVRMYPVGADANGFSPLPAMFDPPRERLLILAPPNCPREAGRRADELVSLLQGEGITVTRSGSVSIRPTRDPSSAEMDQLNMTMLGPLPIVFVGGRARNNPTTDEILAEYRQAKP